MDELIKALPARFHSDGKLSFHYDSAPNRCRQGYQQDFRALAKGGTSPIILSSVYLTRDLMSAISVASIEALSTMTRSLTLKETS